MKQNHWRRPIRLEIERKTEEESIEAASLAITGQYDATFSHKILYYKCYILGEVSSETKLSHDPAED